MLLRSKPPLIRLSLSLLLKNKMSFWTPAAALNSLSMSVVAPPEGSVRDWLAAAWTLVTSPVPNPKRVPPEAYPAV